jgi:GNAT superfamily N-acetyltransferase
MTVRFVEPGDVDALRRYFEALGSKTRYSRFLGATRAVPELEFTRMLRMGDGDHFAVVAEVETGEVKQIIGEARYALDVDAQAVEFGMSIADNWHGLGAGLLLLANLECRAAALGAARMFGDALATNREMLGLARKRGYRFAHQPGDWTLVRFEKDIAAGQDVPCVQSSAIVQRFSSLWW